jgi:hypothetical protein
MKEFANDEMVLLNFIFFLTYPNNNYLANNIEIS